LIDRKAKTLRKYDVKPTMTRKDGRRALYAEKHLTLFTFRWKYYPGLEGTVTIRARRKRNALALARLHIEGAACGAKSIVQRIR